MLINGYYDSWIKGEKIDGLKYEYFEKRYTPKNPKEIYLIINCLGLYEERDDNIIAAFFDKQKAECYCEEYNKELKQYIDKETKMTSYGLCKPDIEKAEIKELIIEEQSQ